MFLRLRTNGAKQIAEAMVYVKVRFSVEVGERSLIDTSLTVRTGVVIKEVNMLV